MGFAVPPKIVGRPGVEDLPNGSCHFTGASLPADGPFAWCHTGEYVTLSAAVELVKAFPRDERIAGVLEDEPKVRFLELLAEIEQLRDRIGSIGKENAQLRERVALLTAAKDEAVSVAASASAELARARRSADLVEEFLHPRARSKPVGKVKVAA